MFITIAFYLQNIWHDGYGHDAVVFAGWELNMNWIWQGATTSRESARTHSFSLEAGETRLRLHHRLQSVFLLSLPAHINQIDTMVKDRTIVSCGAFEYIFFLHYRWVRILLKKIFSEKPSHIVCI